MQLRHLYVFVIDTGVAELHNYDIGETLRCKVMQFILQRGFHMAKHYTTFELQQMVSGTHDVPSFSCSVKRECTQHFLC